MENNVYSDIFENIDKSELFDKVAELFYNRNFGSVSKSETELLMFSIYMDAMIEKYKNSEGVIDYKKCSDYEIAKALGITPERVRTLKVKKQARYPAKDFDWHKSLLSIKDRARYDEHSGKIIIPIPDPNLLIEIRNFIEGEGGYIEMQYSNNLLQMRVENFLLLMYSDLDERCRKEFIKELNTHLKNADKNEHIIGENPALANVKKALGDIVSIAGGVSTMCGLFTGKPIAAVIIEALKNIV